LHLDALQYAYTEETDNPAYKIFLGGAGEPTVGKVP
jgi:hypothetical protein